MAEKRMFSRKIVESDAFLDLPMSAQCLFFHLNMNADDDGFINSPRMIQRTIGASAEDLQILIDKKFILSFDSGVVVIKSWWMNNYIAKDRYKPTLYTEEKAKLGIKENRSYTLNPSLYTNCIQNVDNLYTNCIQNVYADKNRLDKNRLEENKASQNPKKHKRDYERTYDFEALEEDARHD